VPEMFLLPEQVLLQYVGERLHDAVAARCLGLVFAEGIVAHKVAVAIALSCFSPSAQPARAKSGKGGGGRRFNIPCLLDYRPPCPVGSQASPWHRRRGSRQSSQPCG